MKFLSVWLSGIVFLLAGRTEAMPLWTCSRSLSLETGIVPARDIATALAQARVWNEWMDQVFKQPPELPKDLRSLKFATDSLGRDAVETNFDSTIYQQHPALSWALWAIALRDALLIHAPYWKRQGGPQIQIIEPWEPDPHRFGLASVVAERVRKQFSWLSLVANTEGASREAFSSTLVMEELSRVLVLSRRERKAFTQIYPLKERRAVLDLFLQLEPLMVPPEAIRQMYRHDL
jgi:hypothetical protein